MRYLYIALSVIVALMGATALGFRLSPYVARQLGVAEPGRLKTPLPSGEVLGRALCAEIETLKRLHPTTSEAPVVVIASGRIDNLPMLASLARGAGTASVVLVVPSGQGGASLTKWAAEAAPSFRVAQRSGSFTGTLCMVTVGTDAIVWVLGADLASDTVLSSNGAFAFRLTGENAREVAMGWLKDLH